MNGFFGVILNLATGRVSLTVITAVSVLDRPFGSVTVNFAVNVPALV